MKKTIFVAFMLVITIFILVYIFIKSHNDFKPYSTFIEFKLPDENKEIGLNLINEEINRIKNDVSSISFNKSVTNDQHYIIYIEYSSEDTLNKIIKSENFLKFENSLNKISQNYNRRTCYEIFFHSERIKSIILSSQLSHNNLY